MRSRTRRRTRRTPAGSRWLQPSPELGAARCASGTIRLMWTAAREPVPWAGTLLGDARRPRAVIVPRGDELVVAPFAMWRILADGEVARGPTPVRNEVIDATSRTSIPIGRVAGDGSPPAAEVPPVPLRQRVAPRT